MLLILFLFLFLPVFAQPVNCVHADAGTRAMLITCTAPTARAMRSATNISIHVLSQWACFSMSTRNFIGSGQNSAHPLLDD